MGGGCCLESTGGVGGGGECFILPIWYEIRYTYLVRDVEIGAGAGAGAVFLLYLFFWNRERGNGGRGGGVWSRYLMKKGREGGRGMKRNVHWMGLENFCEMGWRRRRRNREKWGV